MNAWVATLVAYVTLAVLEATWLTLSMPFYARQFAKFTASPLAVRSVAAAVATYAVLAVTFWLLVLEPRRGSATGAAFGFAVYGVYNLTNKATLKGYPWTMVAVDIAWGTALFAAVATVHAAVLAR